MYGILPLLCRIIFCGLTQTQQLSAWADTAFISFYVRAPCIGSWSSALTIFRFVSVHHSDHGDPLHPHEDHQHRPAAHHQNHDHDRIRKSRGHHEEEQEDHSGDLPYLFNIIPRYLNYYETL